MPGSSTCPQTRGGVLETGRQAFPHSAKSSEVTAERLIGKEQTEAALWMVKRKHVRVDRVPVIHLKSQRGLRRHIQ